jgi:carboxypeptidase C (cathepsin A)
MLCGCAAGVYAADNKTAEPAPPKELLATTTHAVVTGKTSLEYTTTAGRLILKNDSGQDRAQIFFIAYEKKGGDRGSRPVTFAFNGGPGSSSVWLHLGALGPRRVRLNPDGSVPPAPVELVDNEHTWLAFTDIVFIDPVGTGYSRAVDEKKEKEFYGFKDDIASVGDFIRLYLTRYDRWLSPKYIAGESYGTTRAVGLIDYLHRQHGVSLNGILLISPVLDFNTLVFSQSNDLPYALFLPTYTAAAWYHKKLNADEKTLADLLPAVEDWVLRDYITALAQGDALDPKQRESAATALSGYTGLAQDYIMKNNLRIYFGRFCKELLRDRQLVIGRMDARMTMPDTDGAGEGASRDPSLERLVGAFAGAINHYVRVDLKFKDDTPYTYLNYAAGRAWDWKSGMQGEQGYVSLSQSLTDALHVNNHLRVFIASGYYDLATPFFAARYTVNHLQLDDTLKDHVRLHYYHAGHMMYTELASLRQLTQDAAAFYRGK